ncbi:hypothetical protein WME95_44510 [Sorangium sp. So ce327]|uniref:hypothetical protein n=1 Tax=Sorangium sp. So ce327 TaxID=3133301 RepID=UPI003F63DDC4
MSTKKYITHMMATMAITSVVPGCSVDATEVEDVIAAEQSSPVVGTIELETRVGEGWHMTTEATLRSDGSLTGLTELRNSRSVWGFTGGLIVVLVDDQKQPLAHVRIDRWGLDACGIRCPRKRYVTWTASVPADEWARIGSSVRGIALLQFHDPTFRVLERIFTGLRDHLPEVLSMVAAAAKFF